MSSRPPGPLQGPRVEVGIQAVREVPPVVGQSGPKPQVGAVTGVAAPLCLGSRVQGTSDRTWATALRRRAPVRTAGYRRRARGGCGPRPTQGKARRLYQLNLLEATAHSVAVNPVPRPGFFMEPEALRSAGGGDPAGVVGRVLGPRLAPSPARAQRSLDGPQNQPAAVSGANIALTGGQASRGITASGSWRRESRRNCTGQVPGPRTWGQTDQRRTLLGLPRSVRPTTAPWEGGEVVRGKGETGSPLLVPPTVVEDLTI